MKLAYPEIEKVFTFGNGYFSGVIIENPGLFYRFTDDLHRQCCGEDGAAVLSLDDQPVPLAGKLDLLTDFFSLDINRRTILSKITAKLEKIALSPEFYERTCNLAGQIENLIYDLAFQGDIELEQPAVSAASMLKSSGLSLRDDYSNIAEKLLAYMDLMSSNGLAYVFVLVNLRSMLDDSTLELFTDSCCRKEYNVLLVDNKVYPLLSREKRIIIDNDLCEI